MSPHFIFMETPQALEFARQTTFLKNLFFDDGRLVFSRQDTMKQAVYGLKEPALVAEFLRRFSAATKLYGEDLRNHVKEYFNLTSVPEAWKEALEEAVKESAVEKETQKTAAKIGDVINQ